MISMDEIKERVILVAVDTDGSDQAERSLDELGELAKTAGAEVVGRMIQPRENIQRKNSGIKGIIVGDARNRNYL